jgi:hypothetical protein
MWMEEKIWGILEKELEEVDLMAHWQWRVF